MIALGKMELSKMELGKWRDLSKNDQLNKKRGEIKFIANKNAVSLILVQTEKGLKCF